VNGCRYFLPNNSKVISVAPLHSESKLKVKLRY